MFGNILKTEFVGEENGAYTINCLLDNFISSIDCSIAINDEFGTEPHKTPTKLMSEMSGKFATTKTTSIG